jgi:hypothetical protein
MRTNGSLVKMADRHVELLLYGSCQGLCLWQLIRVEVDVGMKIADGGLGHRGSSEVKARRR